MIRTLGRVWLRLRYVLWQRRRHGRLVLERGLGFPVAVLPGVFNPTLFRTTDVLLEALAAQPVGPASAVLDVGTGSGALAVAAALRGARVVAVDVAPDAVRCARVNTLLNGVEERLEVRRGDLFAPVAGERFDLVVCNPPYYPGAPADERERPFRAGDFAPRFAAGLAGHLRAGGAALVVLSSDGDEDGFLGAFRAAALRAETVVRRHRVTEVVRVWRLTPGGAT